MNKKQISWAIFLGLMVILLVAGSNYFAIGSGADTQITDNQLNNQFVKIEMSWSKKQQNSIKCGQLSYVEVSGLNWNSQNIDDSKGVLVDTTDTNQLDWISQLGTYNIQSAKINYRDVTNLSGTCQVSYESEPFDTEINGQIKTRYNWYIRPTNCKFTGQLDLRDTAGCGTYSDGQFIVFNDNGQLTVSFPKDVSIECIDKTWCQNQLCEGYKCVDSNGDDIVDDDTINDDKGDGIGSKFYIILFVFIAIIFWGFLWLRKN